MKHWFYVPGGEVRGVMVRGSWVEGEVDHSNDDEDMTERWAAYDKICAPYVYRNKPQLVFPPGAWGKDWKKDLT